MRTLLATTLWTALGWLAARRRRHVGPDGVRRWTYRTQTRGMGIRMTERLRDLLRPRWLRVREDNDLAA